MTYSEMESAIKQDKTMIDDAYHKHISSMYKHYAFFSKVCIAIVIVNLIVCYSNVFSCILRGSIFNGCIATANFVLAMWYIKEYDYNIKSKQDMFLELL